MDDYPNEMWIGYENCPIIPGNGHYKASCKETYRDKVKYIRAPQSLVKIITICGSSKFIDIMAVCAWILERDENVIVQNLHLLPKWYPCSENHNAEHEGCADQMDALHLKKIDISDEIFVVNCQNYIGSSCANEIKYAKKLGKTIRYYVGDRVGKEVEKILSKPSESIK